MTRQFDRKTLDYLKTLSRIDCSAEEEEELLNSLSRILEFIEQLDEVATEDVKPCNYVLRAMLKNRVREDQIGESLPHDLFLSNAPDQVEGLIRIPPVLKQ